MKYISPSDRSQSELFSCLDDQIDSESFVRVLDALVEFIVDKNPDRFGIQKENEKGGRPGFHPKTMLKLFLYGYLERIQSSRRLEKATLRNLELMWLLGRLSPDFKTIADFRKDHGKEIKFVCVEFRRFLKEKKYIAGVHMKQDGTKFKANARRGMLNLKRLSQSLNNAEEKLEKYLNQLKHNDALEEEREDYSEENPDQVLIDKIEKLKERINTLEKKKDLVVQSGKSSFSPTDPDANLVKSTDGKVPGYNTQVIVDDKNKMIAYAEVSNQVNDMNQLEPALEGLKEELDIEPETYTADKGYYVSDQIQDIENKGITKCFINVPSKGKKAARDKEAGIFFEYDKENDEYICSQGKRLTLKQRNKKQNNSLVDKYVGIECEGCPLRAICTDSKRGRYLSRRHNKEWVDAYEKRMKSDYSKKILKTRGAVVEHPFGTIKTWMGKIPLLLRGREKVQTEINLITTAYNFKRLINLEKIAKIIEMIRGYNWSNPQKNQISG